MSLGGPTNYTPAAGVGSYWYQFRLVDNYSNYRDQWVEIPVKFTAPTSPQAASVQSYSVALGWTAVSGATSYKVYRGGQLLGTTSSTTYTDNTAQPNTAYSYTVRASNGTSTYDSADSSAVNVTTPAIDPNTDTDGDGVPDYIESQLGTNPNSVRQSDSSNTTQLKIHRPNQ
jgi:cellulose 1,4-beta-cellobiosidase